MLSRVSLPTLAAALLVASAATLRASPLPDSNSQLVFSDYQPPAGGDIVDILLGSKPASLVKEAAEQASDAVQVAVPHRATDISVGPKAGGGWVWSSCGLPTDAVEVESIAVLPDPPKPGQNLTVTAKGKIKSRIEAGTEADVVVKLGLIRLLTKRFDVCEEARKANAQVQCPIDEGEYEITQTVELPREIPPAKFNVHVTGLTQDDKDLLCLDIAIDFMHR